MSIIALALGVALAAADSPADAVQADVFSLADEAFVAQARQTIGDECELMLDCWMAFDVDYTVRLAEALILCSVLTPPHHMISAWRISTTLCWIAHWKV